MASEEEGDLGLVSLLGEGAVSDVGGKCIYQWKRSGLGDTTVVAAQAPITEAEVVASAGLIEASSANLLLTATSTTRLPDSQAQAPIGSTQVPVGGVSQCSSLRFTLGAKLGSLHKLEATKSLKRLLFQITHNWHNLAVSCIITYSGKDATS